VGTSVTVTGTNFGATQGTSTITFNGTAATPTSWSVTSIVAPVPAGATTGNVVVTVGGQASNGVSFTVTTATPSITSLNPSSGAVGTSVTITGTNFGATQGASTITFNGTAATPTSWSATSIVAPVPADATTGNVVVTVGGQASNGVSFTVTTALPEEPTLIQHVSGSNTRNWSLTPPFCYYQLLPNPTTAGNAVIVGFTFNGSSTVTVTDDKSDSYAVEENYYGTTGAQSIAIAATFGVAAGARQISVCFPSSPGPGGAYLAVVASEFSNVTAVDGTGSGANTTGTSVAAGSLTPTVTNDLIYQLTFLPIMTQEITYAAGSQSNITWNLLSADQLDALAAQYGVYASTTAISPTMTLGASEQFVTAAVLFKTGTAGSVPNGMRIVHLQHENIPTTAAGGGNGTSFTNPLTLQFPSSGNLLVALTGGGNAGGCTSTITDSKSNSWAQAGSVYAYGSGSDNTVQTLYAGNATSASNLSLTLTFAKNTCDWSIFFYDVSGAATSPLDTTKGTTGDQSSTSGTLAVPYTITPAQSGELIFTNIIWDYNTATALSSNTGTSYSDANMFSGESISGPEPVDQNNGWGHAISTSTGAITFTWSQGNDTSLAAGPYASMAVAFK